MTVGQTFGEQIALLVSDFLDLGLFMMHAFRSVADQCRSKIAAVQAGAREASSSLIPRTW